MILAVLLVCSAGPPTLRGVDAHGVPLPGGAVARFGAMRWRARSPGDTGPAQVGVSPDGKAVLACGPGGLTVWRRYDGAQLSGPPNADTVCGFHFLPDRRQIILLHFTRGGAGYTGAAFSAHTWPDWKPCAGASRSVELSCLGLPVAAFAPDGKRAVLCGGDPLLMDTAGTRPLTSVGPYDRPVALASFLPGGAAVVLAHTDGGAEVYSQKDGKPIRTVAPADVGKETLPIQAVMCPDGSALFSYRPATSELVRLPLKAGPRVRRRVRGGDVIAVAPDGGQLFVVGRAVVHFLDARSLRVVRTARLARELAPVAAGVSPDGKELLVVTDVGIQVLNATTGQPRRGARGHVGPVRHVAFSPDGRWLATGGDDGAVLLWDVATGRLARAFEGHALGVSSLAFSPDGLFLAAGDGSTARPDADREATVRVWDVTTGSLRWQASAHVGRVGSLAFIDGGKALVTAGPDDRVRWWAVADGKRVGEDRFCAAPTIVTGGDGRRAVIHETRAPGGLWTLGPGDGAPRSVDMGVGGGGGGRGGRERGSRMEVARPELIGGGRMLLLVRVRGEYAWLNISSGRVDRNLGLPTPERPPGAQRFSPDGELLAVGPPEGRGAFAVVEVKTGRALAELSGHNGGPLALEFSPDGLWLASSGPDGAVLLWDVAQVRLQAALDDWVGAEGKGLARKHDEAVWRLNEALKSAARLEHALPRYLERLGDDSFEERERASVELTKMGPAALCVLLRARKPPDAEARERLRRLVGRFSPEVRSRASSTRWVSDAMSSLRRLGTEEARKALRELARMGSDTLVGREASFALSAMK